MSKLDAMLRRLSGKKATIKKVRSTRKSALKRKIAKKKK